MNPKAVALALAIAVSVAAPVAQSREVAQLVEDRQAVVAMFEAVDRGQVPSIAIQRPFELQATFESAANAWIDAAAEADRPRRRDVVAVAVLEVARLSASGSLAGLGTSALAIKQLIEWQCERFRSGPPTEFERRWMIASAVVLHASGDSRLLTGTFGVGATRLIINGRVVEGGEVPCRPKEPCNHAAHIESRFPGEPQVALARVMLEPVIARKPGALAGRIASSKLTRRAEGTPVKSGLETLVDAGVAELRRLSDDPMVGWDARLRLGLALFGLNQRPQSLHELEQVAASTASLELRYVAHVACALNHDAGNHLDQTIASLEAAQALLPRVRSTATLLAAKYVTAGRLAEAHALMDDVYQSEPPAFDPWRIRVGTWAVAGPLDTLREAIRR